MKKVCVFITGICLAVLLSACTSLESNEVIILSNIEQLHNVVSDNKISYIYFGRSTCPDCNDFFPYLEEAIKSISEDVYYFNTDDRKNDDGYEDIIEVFDVVWVPALYKVQDNDIIDAFPLKFEKEPDEEEVAECIDELNKFFNTKGEEGLDGKK